MNYYDIQLRPEIQKIINEKFTNHYYLGGLIIKLELDRIIHLSRYDIKTNEIKLIIKQDSLNIVPSTYKVQGNIIKSYKWEPKTKMNDWETVVTDEKMIMIGENSGICVIIIDALGSYIKLSYNSSKENGLDVIFNRWDHSFMPVDLLKKDLDTGYNVLFVEGLHYENKYDLKYDRKTKMWDDM